jgi:hypothetical protein
MKTKDLIKILQEEDPSGESHVRIGDGNPIFFAGGKPGYWDGPYNYLEKGEDGKFTWVASTEGHKVDIYTMDLFDFAERFQGDWEEMKKHIRVEYTYLDDDERAKSFMKKAEKECKEYKDMRDAHYKDGYEEMVKNAEKGWKWFQDKKVDRNEKPNLHKYYTWKIYNEKGKKEGSCIHNVESIIKSGDWEKLDNKKKRGYYQWIYKPK